MSRLMRIGWGEKFFWLKFFVHPHFTTCKCNSIPSEDFRFCYSKRLHTEKKNQTNHQLCLNNLSSYFFPTSSPLRLFQLFVLFRAADDDSTNSVKPTNEKQQIIDIDGLHYWVGMICIPVQFVESVYLKKISRNGSLWTVPRFAPLLGGLFFFGRAHLMLKMMRVLRHH